MKRQIIRMISLVLTLALLLCGCGTGVLPHERVISFSEMTYTRPDLDALQRSLDSCCEAAEKGVTPEILMTKIQVFYNLYDRFYTNYTLADIHYCMDLTDSYWEEEYNFCSEAMATVDAMLEALYCAIAGSAMRGQMESEEYFGEGFFDDYEESTYDETLIALLERESALVSEYYALTEQTQAEPYTDAYYNTFGKQAAELFVELVRVRQEMAAYMGYDSYQEFAFEAYYGRDYTPDQAVDYLNRISRVLYTPYVTVFPDQTMVDAISSPCGEEDTFAYVQATAKAMGGTVAEAFEFMERRQLYDISFGENKFGSGFETYLTTYQSPFIFLNPYGDRTDKLAFAHEFGHYVNDYACGGSYVGTDVAEVHSQAFEFLSLCYGPEDQALADFKMLDTLSTYMENGGFALFELMVYDLEGEALTVENVQALYRQIGAQFGFDQLEWDERDWVDVPHFFTNGMYVISYVLSNDLALQIYQLELEEKGKGLEVYEQIILSQETYILTFAETYGLMNPFSLDRLDALKALYN